MNAGYSIFRTGRMRLPIVFDLWCHILPPETFCIEGIEGYVAGLVPLSVQAHISLRFLSMTTPLDIKKKTSSRARI